jgi:hemoglobin/transferrin/lactoferrin receptor protein
VQDAVELTEIRQVRTIPEAMRELPGVMVQKTGHGQGSPYIRGFTGLRTLFLIDGIRLNNSTYRDGPNQYWNTVDAFSVDRLEIVKGPSSVLYGSDAIGGTVNAISRSFDSLDGNATRGRLVLRASSAEDSMSVRPEFGFSSDKVAVFAAMSFKKFGNLRAGGETGTQAKTGYQDRNADIKVTYTIADNRHITAALQSTNQDDAWRVHKTIFGESWQGTTVGSELRHSFDQQRVLAYLQYRASAVQMLRGGEMTVSLSHHQQDEQRLRVRQSGEFDRQGTAVDTIGLWGHFDVPVADGSWAAGFEIYRDSVDSFRNDFDSSGNLERSRIQGPVADDASYLLADIYLQNRRGLGQGGELIAGIRYTKSRLEADAVENPTTGEQMSISDHWQKLTGNLRITHPVGHNEILRVFAGISQGFRSPNLSDLTRFDSARTDEIETPVTGLKPERFVSFEIGMKYEEGPWTGQFALYRTAISDMIIRTPTGRIIDGSFEVTKRNSGDGYVNGAELQLRYQLNDSLQVFGNVSWLKGEVDTFPDSSQIAVREPLDRQMPTQLFLGGRWQSAAARFWAEAMLGIADRQDQLSTRDHSDTDRIPPAGTPGYSYFTLRGGWKLKNNWRLSIAAENVFDEIYRIHGSGLNEPGRNVVLSAIYTHK